MPRPASGQIVARERRDGLITYSLRVTANHRRQRLHLGTQEDGWTAARAERELQDVLARIRAGVWSPPVRVVERRMSADPTFHEYATAYLASRKGELRQSSLDDYAWRLSCHLLPFFAECRVSEIDVKLVDAYRAHKVAEREHIKDMAKAGTPARDESGRRIRPLGNETINKTLGLLASILDVAVDHEILAANPARGRRRRLKATRPRRPFLEADEVQSLLAAAEELDRDKVRPSARAMQVKQMRDEWKLTYIDIEKRYNIPRGSAHYLYERATNDRPPLLVRRTIIAVLVGSGLRVGEMCALTWRDVNLDKRRLDVTDAKTPTGVREVELSPWLVDELRTFRAAITDLRPDSPVLPSAAGTARDRKGVCNNVVKKAVARADEIRVAAGGSPLPRGITPHALRCTYISLLLESGHPLPYVMAQVGHADESTTLQIYARVMKRRPREAQHAAFDALIVGERS